MSKIKNAIEECYSCEGRKKVYDPAGRLMNCPVCEGSGFIYSTPENPKKLKRGVA